MFLALFMIQVNVDTSLVKSNSQRFFRGTKGQSTIKTEMKGLEAKGLF